MGASARRTLPTTWVQSCSVTQLSCQPANTSGGHARGVELMTRDLAFPLDAGLPLCCVELVLREGDAWNESAVFFTTFRSLPARTGRPTASGGVSRRLPDMRSQRVRIFALSFWILPSRPTAKFAETRWQCSSVGTPHLAEPFRLTKPRESRVSLARA